MCHNYTKGTFNRLRIILLLPDHSCFRTPTGRDIKALDLADETQDLSPPLDTPVRRSCAPFASTLLADLGSQVFQPPQVHLPVIYSGLFFVI